MSTQNVDSFELSPQQEQLWLAAPGGPQGRIQAVIALTGPLQAAAVRAALEASVARHEILRTTFISRPGIRVPLQSVTGEMPPIFSTVEMAGGARSSTELDELTAAERAQPLDLASGPLLRALLVKLGPDQHALILTVSSLCADASSLAVLTSELACGLGADAELADDPLQYADFAAWQRELAAGDDGETTAAGDFWTASAGAPDPAVPFAGPTLEPSGRSERIELELSAHVQAGLDTQAGRYGASPTSLVQAAWGVVLAAGSGEPAVTMALVSAERRHADLDGAIGAFARAVPIAAAVKPAMSFAELLGEVDHAVRQAAVWQDYRPVAAAAPALSFFSGEGYSGRAGALEVSLERVEPGGESAGLWLVCLAAPGRLSVALQFDPAFLAAEHARRLAARLAQLLEDLSRDVGVPIGELNLIPEAEREQLAGYAGGAGAVSGPAVHARFSAHAAQAPDRAAVIDEHGSLSYGALERRANQLAHRLLAGGAGTGSAIGLCTDRSVDMIVGLLGILKAGAAYVPLHYEHPPARLAHQLSTAGATAIVTQVPLLSRLPESFGGERICLDGDRAELDREPADAPDAGAGPESLAYIIYTSGSTGTPKGVAVAHGSLANYAAQIIRQLGADREPLAFGVVTSISTDLGNTSVFGALASGGTLVLVSPAAAADAGAMSAALSRSPIDVLKITPSHIGALTAGGESGVLPRRWLVIGGERAPWDLVARIRRIGSCAILNHYGPTEATVGCATFTVADGPGPYRPATVPIGRPLGGDRALVLDDRLALVPIGAPGRLYIGGAGVAQGYIGAPELTAERFLSDPVASDPAARLYDTGDIARWLPDGSLEFLGRVDEQIKIRGYRVEPAEVESALRAHADVRDAVVAVRTSPAGGESRLVAYCTTGGAADENTLRAHLAGWLPEFMLPSALVILDAMPMTPSGKIDRLALPDPDDAAPAIAGHVTPRTPVEQALAAIWAHVLGLPQVGAESDFFALGGHSLLATQVVAHVRSDFAVELPLHSLFTYPTVASLAQEIVRMMGDTDDEETARLMAELAELSDEEAERLLAGEAPHPDA